MNELLPIAEALRTWIGAGRGGRPIAPSTAWRWSTVGTVAGDGARVRLRLTRIGGRLYLKHGDLDEFIRACSAAPLPAPAPVAAPRADTAEVLSRAGIRPGTGRKAAHRG